MSYWLLNVIGCMGAALYYGRIWYYYNFLDFVERSDGATLVIGNYHDQFSGLVIILTNMDKMWSYLSFKVTWVSLLM